MLYEISNKSWSHHCYAVSMGMYLCPSGVRNAKPACGWYLWCVQASQRYLIPLPFTLRIGYTRPMKSDYDPTQYVAIMWHFDKQAEVHYFRLPSVSEPGFYRSVGSFESFRKREANRLYNWMCDPNRKDHLARRASMDHVMDSTFLRFQRDFGALPHIPVFNHDSIWGLYEAIGYDHKKKRYTEFPYDRINYQEKFQWRKLISTPWNTSFM